MAHLRCGHGGVLCQGSSQTMVLDDLHRSIHPSDTENRFVTILGDWRLILNRDTWLVKPDYRRRATNGALACPFQLHAELHRSQERARNPTLEIVTANRKLKRQCTRWSDDKALHSDTKYRNLHAVLHFPIMAFPLLDHERP